MCPQFDWHLPQDPVTNIKFDMSFTSISFDIWYGIIIIMIESQRDLFSHWIFNNEGMITSTSETLEQKHEWIFI